MDKRSYFLDTTLSAFTIFLCFSVWIFFFKYTLGKNRFSKCFYMPVLVWRSQAVHQQLRLEPYAVHTTFQYAGTEGKRHRLREGMLFFDQPSYYDSPGTFPYCIYCSQTNMLGDHNAYCPHCVHWDFCWRYLKQSLFLISWHDMLELLWKPISSKPTLYDLVMQSFLSMLENL